MPQFVPHCPLKNEKGLRQHPFTINHYSPYNIPIGFYGNDSPAGVPRLPAHLKEAGELQCKKIGLCHTRHSSCTAPPALAGHSAGTNPSALVHSTGGKVQNFYSPILKKHCMEKATSTSHGQCHTPVLCPRTVTALNLNVRGQVLLCSLGSHTPGRGGGSDGN